MTLATSLLVLVSGYISLKLVGLTRSRARLKFIGLTIAALILLLMQLAVLTEPMVSDPTFTKIARFVFEWGHISCLAFVLSSLAVFIRDSKPVFAQFPMLYTALPLLIVISYILVKDTYALKNWLIAIYQGGAITVALLMYSVYTYRRYQYALILVGVMIFLLTYILYWHLPVVNTTYPWMWKLSLAVGIVVTVLGYEKADQAVITASVDN